MDDLDDIYVRRFMEFLGEEGTPAVLSGPSPLMIAGIQLDCISQVRLLLQK